MGSSQSSGRERGVNINYNGVMNALIKFRAGCTAAPPSCRARIDPRCPPPNTRSGPGAPTHRPLVGPQETSTSRGPAHVLAWEYDSGLVTLRPRPAARSRLLGWPPHLLSPRTCVGTGSGGPRRPLTSWKTSPLGRCFFKA